MSSPALRQLEVIARLVNGFSRRIPELAATLRLYSRWLAAEFRAVAGVGWRSARGDSDAASAWFLVRMFPPDTSAGVYRPLSFVQEADRQGWTVEVFCGPPAKEDSVAGAELLTEVPDGVRVHEVATRSEPILWRLTPRMDGTLGTALDIFETAAVSRGLRPSVIVACGPTFDMFLAARWLARHFRVPLVLDYRDEWNLCPLHWVRTGWAGRLMEPRCLRCADAVVFATRSFREHALANQRALDSGKCRVVPNGWQSAEVVARPKPRGKPGVSFVLTLLGALSPQTLPGSFLDTLTTVLASKPTWRNEFRLRFVGRRHPVASAPLAAFSYPDMVDIVDHVPRGEVGAILEASDALLLLHDPRWHRYRPGKLYDYLASSRPVLMFHDSSDSESDRLIGKLGAGVVLPEPSASQLHRALSTMRRGSPEFWATTKRAEWASRHTRRRSAERFMEVVGACVSAAPVRADGRALGADGGCEATTNIRRTRGLVR